MLAVVLKRIENRNFLEILQWDQRSFLIIDNDV